MEEDFQNASEQDSLIWNDLVDLTEDFLLPLSTCPCQTLCLFLDSTRV